MATYPIDMDIIRYLSNVMMDGKVEKVLSIFRTIDNINKIPLLDINIDTSELEAVLTDLISREDEFSSDDLRSNIDNVLKMYFLKYLDVIGIIINKDIFFYVIDDIYSALFTILTIEYDFIPDIISRLRTTEDDDSFMLSNLLSEYTTISSLELYELIDDVKDEFIDYLIKYLTQLSFTKNTQLDSDLRNDIEKLLVIDHNFGLSPFVNMCMNTEYTYPKLEDNLNTMYNNLNKIQNNIEIIPYEVVSVLFMSFDSRINMLDYFKEDIDLTHIDTIKDDTILLENVTNKIDELIRKIMV